MKTQRQTWIRKMLAQQLRTLRREGVLYTPEPINYDQWRANLRATVIRQCAGKHEFRGVAETAVCLYAMERDGISYAAAIKRHIGSAKSGSGPDANAPHKRLAKWKAEAAKRR